jgi:hypothetical protein
MIERRVAPRLKTLLSGRCVHEAGSYDCSVLNVSLSGARLSFGSAVALPDRFTLHISGKGNSQVATVAWRRGLEVGVSFDQPAAAATEAPASLRVEPASAGGPGVGPGREFRLPG